MMTLSLFDKHESLICPPESYYENPVEHALANPFNNGCSNNRYIVAVGQRENERAFLTSKAMQNTAILSDLERQYAEADPAGAEYYRAIMMAYTSAEQDTIFNYGGSNGRKKWR